MNIGRVYLSIKNRRCNPEELQDFITELCCNSDMQLYYLGDWENKLSRIIEFIFDLRGVNVDFLISKDHAGDRVIKDRVGILPRFKIIDLIIGLDTYKYILIDYEAPDEVFGTDRLNDIVQSECFYETTKKLSRQDIKLIMDFIIDIDLIDYIELANNISDIRDKDKIESIRECLRIYDTEAANIKEVLDDIRKITRGC